MAHRLSSPPLIKGIDGIVSRSLNEVNYSTLIEKNMESQKPLGHEIRRKFKYGLRKKERYVKENAGKYKYLMTLAKTYGCEIPTINKEVEADGNEGGGTGEPQANKIRVVGGRARRGFEFGCNKMKKEWNCTGKIKNLIEPGDWNKIEVTKTDGEDDGEESGETGEPQQPIRRKFSKFGLKKMENTDMKDGEHGGKSRI